MNLALRIPPPLIAIGLILVAWLLSYLWPSLTLSFTGQRFLAIACVAAGFGLDVLSLKHFWSHRTTVNPLKPEATSSLVKSGPYRFSRNPMYLGLLMILIGAVIWFGNPIGVVVTPLFVALINRLQIIPEEVVMQSKFGEEFERYQAEVGRWLTLPGHRTNG